MKKVIIVMAVLLSLSACSSDSDYESSSKNIVPTQVTIDDKGENIAQQLSALFAKYDNKGSATRANGLIVDKNEDKAFAEEAQRIFAPFAVEGAQMREELLKGAAEGTVALTNEEMNDLKSLSNADLAGMAYFTKVLSYYDDQPVSNERVTYENNIVFNCLAEAIGVNDIKRLFENITHVGHIVHGTRMLMTARTGLRILKSLGLRYMGYIGMAYTVYEFARCVNDKNPNTTCVYVKITPHEDPYSSADIAPFKGLISKLEEGRQINPDTIP